MLDDRQLLCLQALVDTVIPAGDYPGGWEAGVGDYLLRQLESDLAAQLSLYRLFLEALDGESRAAQGQPFADLRHHERTALLEAIEAGRVETTWLLDPASCFALIVEHCTEGFYSDPGNGGNRGAISWEMIGFEVRG